MKSIKFFEKCIIWCICAVLVLLFIAWITMVLWNWLIPDLFNGPIITYWQACGLLLLSKILTWGFTKQRGHGAESPYWKKRFQDKLATMKPEEREAFKQKMKEKWCKWDQQRETDPDQR